jgi:hypothetical protein
MVVECVEFHAKAEDLKMYGLPYQHRDFIASQLLEKGNVRKLLVLSKC